MRRYAGMVYHVCLQVTKNAHDAEDATQAVFLTLAVQAKTGKEIHTIGPWLQQVGKRLSLDLRKSRKRRQKREERHNFFSRHNGNGNGNGDHSLPLQNEELKTVLNEELHNLPAKYRLPLILHYFGGLSREAMATELRCKPGTLGARLHRGRALLGVRLAERGVGWVDGALASAVTLSIYNVVTDSLVLKTTEAATRLAAGRELGVGLISANVLGMVRRAVQMALYAKLKSVAIALVLAGSVVAGTAEVVSRTCPIDLHLPRPSLIGGRIWDALRPVFRLTYSQAPAEPQSIQPSLVAAKTNPVNTTSTVAAPVTPDWMNRPQWTAPPIIDSSIASLPPLFPSPTKPATQVLSPAQIAALDSSREPLLGAAPKPRLAVGPIVAPPVTPSPPTPAPLMIRAAVAIASTPPPPTPVTRDPLRPPDFRPLTAAPLFPVPPIAQQPTPSDPPVPVSPFKPGDKTNPFNPPPADNWYALSLLANNDAGRNVALFPAAPTTSTNTQSSSTPSSATNSTTNSNTISGTELAITNKPTLSYTADSISLFQVPLSAQSSFTPYATLQPSTTTSAAAFVPAAPATAATPVVAAFSGIPLRGVRTGPSSIFRAYGIVEHTNVFDQSGRVIADGLGSPQTLDLSQVKQIIHSIPNSVMGGTSGWFAQDQGKLVLPPITVATGDGTYNWGESITDSRLDLINSVQASFDNVTRGGTLNIALLSLDRPDIPTLPSGHHFVGVWEVGAPNLLYDQLDLTVRYDSTMVTRLGLNDANLKLWKYDDGQWQIVRDDFSLDREHKLISGQTGHLSYFAVSSPEPGGFLILAAAALFLGRRRRRP